MAEQAPRLVFAEGLIGNYISGEAVWTFRKYRPKSHEFTKGQIIEGYFKDGMMLLLEVLEDTRLKPFRDIAKEEYEAWGAVSHEDMMRQMRNHYVGLTVDDTAALVHVRLARIEGRPIAGLLPEGI